MKKNRAITLSVVAFVSIMAISIATVQFAIAPTNVEAKPSVKFKFRVEIDGIASASFQEAEGLNIQIEVTEYREGTDPNVIYYIPGLASYGPITLKRGLTTNQEFWDWIQGIADGDDDTRNGSIIVMSPNGNDVMRFNFVGAWPSKLVIGDLDGLSKGIVIEEITLQVEGIEWEVYENV